MLESPGAYVSFRASAAPTLLSDVNKMSALSAQTGADVISMMVAEAGPGEITEDQLLYSEPRVRL